MIYDIEVSETEFRLLRDFIHDKVGIYLKDEKRSLLQLKLSSRLLALGFNSFGEYLYFIKYTRSGEREFSIMLSLLTNNETYFFREYPQLVVYRDFILPELQRQKIAQNDKSLRILSAGCSTGEEVYTLAILAFESGIFFWGWDVQIIGMDISEKVLEVAKRGVYYERSFRMTEQKYLEKFFSTNSRGFHIKNNIKMMTSFVQGNILNPESWNTLKNFDLIFCRNVLIYFSEEKIKTAITNFYHSLKEGGYLFLGHAETLTGMSEGFEPKRFPDTIVYQKKGRKEE